MVSGAMSDTDRSVTVTLPEAARQLGRQMRVPGFRKGKVPAPVVIRRLGREAVLDEALRGALGGWYADAIEGAGIAPVGEPELDLGEPAYRLEARSAEVSAMTPGIRAAVERERHIAEGRPSGKRLREPLHRKQRWPFPFD